MRYRFIAFALMPLFSLSACSILPKISGDINSIDSGDVTVYRENSPPSRSYELISIVNGESCQRQFEGPEASDKAAIQVLKIDAAQFKAQAVINTQCFSLKPDADSICYSEVSCTGRAIQWRD